MSFVNVSAYKFIDLEPSRLPEHRRRLRERAQALDLKGTILLAPEGVNCFVAGMAQNVVAFKTFLEAELGATDFPYKDSFSETQPFNRMLVRLKKEIITMGTPDVRPARSTGKRVSPLELKAWLDAKRDVVVLDTRNDYEVKMGTFAGAIDMKLQTFRQFPSRAAELPAGLRSKTVVAFCTGGIRCEKATAYLASQGFNDVYQLDGGILKYFEDTGGAHYQGDCFVFDHRVALDSSLKPTGATLCRNCQMPLTTQEQASARFSAGRHCPHCIDGKPVPHKEKISEELKRRQRENA